MTMKEMLTKVVEGAVVDAEMAEKAQAELAKMAKESATRAAKAKEKAAAIVREANEAAARRRRPLRTLPLWTL